MSHSFVTANTPPNPPITELITITVATATHPTKQPLFHDKWELFEVKTISNAFRAFYDFIFYLLLNAIFFEFAFAVVHFWRHISVSLRNQFGILSIAVTWYNRAMALFERGNIPALNFIISNQSELKPLNFFILAEGAFWYPWFDDLTS